MRAHNITVWPTHDFKLHGQNSVFHTATHTHIHRQTHRRTDTYTNTQTHTDTNTHAQTHISQKTEKYILLHTQKYVDTAKYTHIRIHKT